jgi:hypothetical protein
MKKAYVIREPDRVILLEKDKVVSKLGIDFYKQLLSFNNDSSFVGDDQTAKVVPIASLPDKEIVQLLLADRGYTY